jgi:hypothetical protein
MNTNPSVDSSPTLFDSSKDLDEQIKIASNRVSWLREAIRILGHKRDYLLSAKAIAQDKQLLPHPIDHNTLNIVIENIPEFTYYSYAIGPNTQDHPDIMLSNRIANLEKKLAKTQADHSTLLLIKQYKDIHEASKKMEALVIERAKTTDVDISALLALAKK